MEVIRGGSPDSARMKVPLHHHMTAAEIEAIAGGYHGDPFRILGPHRVRKARGRDRWEVRAFLPQAAAADVLITGDADLLAVASIADLRIVTPREFWTELRGGAR